MRKIYAIDWSGALDRAKDPIALIQSLKMSGARVYITSSILLPPSAETLVRLSDGFIDKFMFGRNLINEIRSIGSAKCSVTIVDDQPMVSAAKEILEFFGHEAKIINISELEDMI